MNTQLLDLKIDASHFLKLQGLLMVLDVRILRHL